MRKCCQKNLEAKEKERNYEENNNTVSYNAVRKEISEQKTK